MPHEDTSRPTAAPSAGRGPTSSLPGINHASSVRPHESQSTSTDVKPALTAAPRRARAKTDTLPLPLASGSLDFSRLPSVTHRFPTSAVRQRTASASCASSRSASNERAGSLIFYFTIPQEDPLFHTEKRKLRLALVSHTHNAFRAPRGLGLMITSKSTLYPLYPLSDFSDATVIKGRSRAQSNAAQRAENTHTRQWRRPMFRR